MTGLESIRQYEKECLELGMFFGSDATKQAVRVLTATIHTYIEELIDARAERVVELQCYIRQLRAVIDTMHGKPNVTPMI